MPVLPKEFDTRSGEEAASKAVRKSRENATRTTRKAAPCTGAASLENMDLSPVFYHKGAVM